MNEQTNSNKSGNGNLGQFILGKTLGEGTFGRVKIATHITTGEKVAIKILEKIKILEESDKVRIDREIKILKSLMHKNIIQIYSVIENPTTIFLIMEYVNGGELFEYICLKQRLTELEACKFYQDIISGIEYLHKQGIVHRDLKPENLLLNNKKELKIVDFGLSNIYRKGELLKTPCGSPCYAAPEMILGKRYNGLYVDIWSSGIILFAMIFGYLPFDDPNTDILYKKITDGKFSVPSSASERFRDFIKKILVTDPSKRIGLDGIKSHPWFNLITPKLFQGIFIKKYIIPVDETVLEEMKQLNFNKEEVRELILANRHNHITTTYYLILKKRLKLGKTSVSDLSSDEYMRYINDPKNLKQSIKKSIDKPPNSLELSKDTQYSIQGTVETFKNSHKTNETAILMGTSTSYVKSERDSKYQGSNHVNIQIDSNTFKENNPDYHNIYDEDIVTNSAHQTGSLKGKENVLVFSKELKENKIENYKNQTHDNNYTDNLITEANNVCFTEININYSETDHQNNVLFSEVENTNNYVNTKENHGYLETVISQEVTLTETDNKKLENLIKSTEENMTVPEYLPTEINNIITSSQGVNTLYQDTENVSVNMNLNVNHQIENQTNNYSNYICQTDNDVLRTSVNKNEKNVSNSTNENVVITEGVKKRENEEESYINIKKSNLKAHKINNQIAYVNNKKNINFVKINNNEINSTSRNKNQTKIDVLNNSYHENIVNTETNFKKTVVNERLNTLGKTTQNSILVNKNHRGDNYKNQYDLYLRSIVKTKAERFKKGFFDTSVSFEKSADIKNRTFDGKMYESSKSKSKENSPIAIGKNLNYNKFNVVKYQNNNGNYLNMSYNTSVNKDKKDIMNSKQISKNKNDPLNTESSVNDDGKDKKILNVNNTKNVNFNTLARAYKLASNLYGKKKDKRLNTSCPENAEYIKTEGIDIYTIKEDDEYKKTKINKYKIPIYRIVNPSDSSRNKTDNLSYDRSYNNSLSKTKDSSNRENSINITKIDYNTKTLTNKVKAKIVTIIPTSKEKKEKSNQYEIKQDNFGQKSPNLAVTPPKFSNYGNYKNTMRVNQNNKTNNNSLNSSGLGPKLNNTLTPDIIKTKILNISDNIGKLKNTSDVKSTKNSTKNKIDISPLKIPIDKNAYNNKYKNININFYQNIIINNTNNKKASNNNSYIKDEEDKYSKRESPYFVKNTYDMKNGGLSVNKNNASDNSNKINIDPSPVKSLNENNSKSKYSANSKVRSTSKSGSINSDNLSKTTLTSNFSAEEELKIYNGPVDLVCMFNQKPLKLREEILKALSFHKISIKPVLNNKFILKCQKYKLKFDLEIQRYNEQENLLVLKFKKTEGNQEEFKNITSKIINMMKNI